MKRQYPNDLSDKEWQSIEKFFEVSYKKGGRPPSHSKKEILEAIFYILRTGCQWRYLPHDYPPWKTVYTYFRNWKKHKIFELINDDIRKRLRIELGRKDEPTACIIDSQSVKTVEKGGPKAMMGRRRLKVGKGT